MINPGTLNPETQLVIYNTFREGEVSLYSLTRLQIQDYIQKTKMSNTQGDVCLGFGNWETSSNWFIFSFSGDVAIFVP